MTANAVFTNPDLLVDDTNKQRWNQPAHRRHGFHNAHRLLRRMFMVRSRNVLGLIEDPVALEGRVNGLRELTGHSAFSALTCVQGNRIIYEHCADDFSPHQPHSIQSITKLHIHLIVGRLVARGLLDVRLPVRNYLPDIGSGYADARVQDLLDMAVDNDFSEDYNDPNSDCYSEEIALGWRLPPAGQPEISLQEFVSKISGYRPDTKLENILYKSANTDVLTLICQAVCPHGLTHEIEAIADAVGYEAAFHISLSPEHIPAFSGGGCLSARDLARFGQLFARKGADLQGNPFANQSFMTTSQSRATLTLSPPKDWLRYSNHMMCDGRFIGHAGYGGQFLLVDTRTQISCAYLSVLENDEGYDADYMGRVLDVLKGICQIGVARG
jgi:CubicO group peptidase (beta-lactamase class C family)